MSQQFPAAMVEQFVDSCKAIYPIGVFLNTVRTHHSVLEVLSLTFSAVALVYSFSLWLMRNALQRWKRSKQSAHDGELVDKSGIASGKSAAVAPVHAAAAVSSIGPDHYMRTDEEA